MLDSELKATVFVAAFVRYVLQKMYLYTEIRASSFKTLDNVTNPG